MIYTRIFKSKTVNLRGSGLKPQLFDHLPRGFNAKVLEYSNDDKEAVVIVWCSDHPLMDPIDQKNQADLQQFDKDTSVIEVLATHPKRPEKFCQISVSGKSAPIEKVDKTKKQVTVKGVTGPYMRHEKRKDTKGEEIDVYVLDEA